MTRYGLGGELLRQPAARRDPVTLCQKKGLGLFANSENEPGPIFPLQTIDYTWPRFPCKLTAFLLDPGLVREDIAYRAERSY